MDKKFGKNFIYKYGPQIILFILLVLQLGCSIFICQNRRIVTDEIYSLGLANNTEDYLFFSDDQIAQYANEGGWFPGEKMHDYLTVQPDERFDYANVFQKQGQDVHPPLFYLLEHTLYSMAPDSQNYMLVYGLNMVIVMLVTVVIFMGMRKATGDSVIALTAGTFWVFGEASFQLVTYVRMYALLSLWISLILYLHVCFLTERKWSLKRLVQLALCVMAGGLTHYYFYVCTFFVAFYYVILQMWDIFHGRQKWKNIFRYAGAYLAGGGAAILIFPRALYHVLKTNVGKEVQGNLAGGESLLKDFWNVWKDCTWDGAETWQVAVILLAVTVGIGLVIYKKKELDEQQQRQLQIAGVFAAAGISYFLLITKITIYVAWYYISPVFVLSQVAVWIALYACWQSKSRKLAYAVIMVIILMNVLLYLPGKISGEIQQNQNRKQERTYLEEMAGGDCMYISESWSNLYGNRLPDMSYMDEVRCITVDDLLQSDVVEILKARTTANQKVVIMIRGQDYFETCAEYIQENTGRTMMKLWEDGKNCTYILES